jgi:putative endonuclease
MSCLDVLRVSAVERALRDLVCRDDSRFGEALWEHKVKAVPGFTAKYGIDRLVWYESHASMEAAFVQERQIKKWKREWKIQLIEPDNPQWIDLYASIAQ